MTTINRWKDGTSGDDIFSGSDYARRGRFFTFLVWVRQGGQGGKVDKGEKPYQSCSVEYITSIPKKTIFRV